MSYSFASVLIHTGSIRGDVRIVQRRSLHITLKRGEGPSLPIRLAAIEASIGKRVRSCSDVIAEAEPRLRVAANSLRLAVVSSASAAPTRRPREYVAPQLNSRRPMVVKIRKAGRMLAELAELYKQGAWSRDDYFHRITLLAPDAPLAQVIEEIPMPDRDDFVQWIRRTYDNDLPEQDFIAIGYQGDAALTQARIARIRTWLSANR